MAPLLGLLADGDGAVRQKGLMALSCLVRHSPPAVQRFHEVLCHDLVCEHAYVPTDSLDSDLNRLCPPQRIWLSWPRSPNNKHWQQTIS